MRRRFSDKTKRAFKRLCRRQERNRKMKILLSEPEQPRGVSAFLELADKMNGNSEGSSTRTLYPLLTLDYGFSPFCSTEQDLDVEVICKCLGKISNTLECMLDHFADSETIKKLFVVKYIGDFVKCFKINAVNSQVPPTDREETREQNAWRRKASTKAKRLRKRPRQ